jgi:hypothetical protein
MESMLMGVMLPEEPLGPGPDGPWDEKENRALFLPGADGGGYA